MPLPKQDAPTTQTLDGLACSLVVLLATLAAHPFVEMGLVDDFSYVRTALDFAHTGHLLYNGWATAMLGWQPLWAALFIKLAGPGFFATRLSVLVLAIFAVQLVHAVAQRCGLSRHNAIFAALLCGLSPLSMPLSITFMTDTGGAFVILLSLYLCLRALQAPENRAALWWLIAANVAGLLGGTSRQIAWLTVLVMTPSTAWLLRKRGRSFLLVGVVAWPVCAAGIVLTLRWFSHQPFSVPEPLIPPDFHLRLLRELAGTLVACGLCLLFLLLPILVAGVASMRRLRPARVALAIVAALVATPVARLLTFHLPQRGYFPWAGDIINRLGIFDYSNAWVIGTSATAFSHTGRVAASFLVLALSFLFVLALRANPSTGEPQYSEASKLSVRTLVWLFAPFTLAYICLLVPRGLWAEILDRYLLPLLPLAVIAILRFYQGRIAPALPASCYVALTSLALFTVLGTHDWIELHRARLAAVDRLQQAGVHPLQISAGYEFDGTTQIAAAGAVYDHRVRYPTGFQTVPHLPANLPADCKRLYNDHTPSLQPTFWITYSSDSCLAPSSFGTQTFTTWLPPLHRQVFIQQLAAPPQP